VLRIQNATACGAPLIAIGIRTALLPALAGSIIGLKQGRITFDLPGLWVVEHPLAPGGLKPQRADPGLARSAPTVARRRFR